MISRISVLRWLMLPLGALLLHPVASWSADGVLEINGACAAVGCFPGDDPGFPVTITGAAGHSYRLTSDLSIFSASTSGIQITGPDVTLDLAGFRISGGRLCTGACPLPGSQQGILGGASVEVRNGSVVGFFGRGVSLGTNAVVRDLRVSNNGSAGIYVSDGCRVTGNIVYDNGSDGIRVASGCTVSGNSVDDNGGNGIYVGAGTIVIGNALRENTGFGLRTTFNPNSGYTQNTITGSDAGTVRGGVNLGANSCDFAATCP